MKLRFQLWMFVIFFLLTGCVSTQHLSTPTQSLTGSSQQNSGIFSEKPCKAPCWQNLTPGQSTKNDVEHIINGLNKSDWPSNRSFSYLTGCEGWQISNVSEVVSFNIEDGKLTFIELSSEHLTNLQDLVNHLGPPEYFEAVWAIGPDGSTYSVEVYYPSQGLAFIVSHTQTDVGYIKPSMVVVTAHYLAPGSLLSYFTARKSCSIGQADAITEAQREISVHVQPWSGFGAVKVTP